MARKTIRKITSSKTFLIIVSCLSAILLWMYVINVENTDMENTISGIPVTYIGEEDILADRQLIVTDKNEQTVSLRIYGKRSIVSSIGRNDISVSVDLTDIRNTGKVARVYNVAFTNGVKTEDVYIDKTPDYITVNIDRVSSKLIEIRGESNITVAEGYMAEPTEYNPGQLTISGPEDAISRVAYAWVVVERENLSKTVTGMFDYKLMDEDGREVTSDEIEVNVEQIELTIPIVLYKDVVLTVELIDGGGAKAKDAVVEINPPTIALSGDAEMLSNMNQISIGRIDLSSFVTSTTETFTIPVSNDIKNLSGVKEASVTVSLKNLATKRLIVSNIEFTNVSAGYTAVPVTQYLELTVRGPQEIVELINAYNIRIVGDLTDLGQAAGRYAVVPKIYIDGYSDAGVVGASEHKLVVSLEEDD